MTAEPPKECPTSSRTSRMLSGLRPWMKGERPVAPVALGISESEVVEPQHSDAVAGELLADSARGRAVLAEGEAVGEYSPPANLTNRNVDDAGQQGSGLARETDAFSHAGSAPVRPTALRHGEDQLSAHRANVDDATRGHGPLVDHIQSYRWAPLAGERLRSFGAPRGSVDGVAVRNEVYSRRRSDSA